MADATSDEQKPLKQNTQSIVATMSDEEEEKGGLLLPFNNKHKDQQTGDQAPIPSLIPNTYQNESSTSTKSTWHHEHDLDDELDPNLQAKEEEKDASKSPFTICRIVLFLYAFVSILINANFPEQGESLLEAEWRGWFKFFVSINIIACILGMCGVYLYRTRWIFICWVLLTVSIVLTGFLVLAYAFNDKLGAGSEASNRCKDWIANDDTFSDDESACWIKMKTQLLWTTIGLYIVYCIGAGFGIHIIRSSEIYITAYLAKHPPKTYGLSPRADEEEVDDDDDDDDDDLVSELSEQEQQDLVEENDNNIRLERKKDR